MFSQSAPRRWFRRALAVPGCDGRTPVLFASRCIPALSLAAAKNGRHLLVSKLLRCVCFPFSKPCMVCVNDVCCDREAKPENLSGWGLRGFCLISDYTMGSPTNGANSMGRPLCVSKVVDSSLACDTSSSNLNTKISSWVLSLLAVRR